MDLTGYPPHIFDVKPFVNLTETAFSKQLCQLISIFKQWPGVVIWLVFWESAVIFLTDSFELLYVDHFFDV